jgi:hypothetical protein
MRKTLLLLFALFAVCFYGHAQQSLGGRPYSFDHPLNDNLESARQQLPRIDVSALQRRAQEVALKGEMLPAGQILPVRFSPANSGVWTTLPNGDRVWRLRLQVPDAPATSLYYEDFYLPEGASLFVYNAEQTHVIGAFGYINNNVSRLFATEIVYTGECVLEYYEPVNVKQPGSFIITGVANVYNAPEPPAHIHLRENPKAGFGTSGSCNVNVNCPEGNSWANQKNSAARILVKNGANQGWCSGALINNVAQDCKNYFLTANHCGASALAADKNQWIFYFNYQSTGCTNPASDFASNTITGCTMRASASNGVNSSVVGSDFLLVELNSAIPAAYNLYYSGFDASGTGSNSGVGIHHPAGDIKKISAYTSALTSRRYYSQLPDNSHWQANWVATATNYGITEGGSSGSPLYNAAGLLVGKLSGGPSFCTAMATNKNDYYGKLSYDWTSNGTTASQQLKPWLDPANTGTTSVAGKLSCAAAGCPDIQEPNNTQATAGTIVPPTTYKALIATGTDNDYYKFTVAAGTNIVLSLTNLPFDYDLQLLNSAGVLVGISALPGTTNEIIRLNNAAAGTYTVRVLGYLGAFSATNCYSLQLITTSTCGNTPEPNESLAAAAAISANANVFSQIGTATDADWYQFTNTAAASNIYVTLTSLPFDYDLYLYNAAGTLLGTSTGGGTADEAIIYNTTTAGTYYVRVIGYNNAFSTSLCYTLRSATSGTPKNAAATPAIAKAPAEGIQISPNPGRDKLRISYPATLEQREDIIIITLTGQRIYTQANQSHTGNNQVDIVLPASMGKGLYLVQAGSRKPVKWVKE